MCPTGFYGAERWILALVKYLNKDNINCQLAVTRESEDQNIELYRRFKALGLNAYQIKMHGRFDPLAILRLATLIKRQKIDIIHTHGYKSDVLGLLAARITGIKAIATPHGFENVKDIKLQIFIKLGCFTLKYFDKVVPLSDELNSEMKRIKVSPKRIEFVKNGIDLEEIELEKEKTFNPIVSNNHEKIIGYIGQMAFRKNIKDILKTFDLLYKENKNIRLLLIGDGPQKSALEKQARNMTSSSKIDFFGYRNDRLRILRGFDLFSMTSSLEGIPRGLMEAMAMGIPVAAYNISGIDKLINDGETGLLSDFGNVHGLKICWERLLFDTKFAEQIAQNGRKHIIDNFSPERMAGEYTSIYREIIKP